MKRDQVSVGKFYLAKMSSGVAVVLIDSEALVSGGLNATHLARGEKIIVKASILKRQASEEEVVAAQAQAGPQETFDGQPASEGLNRPFEAGENLTEKSEPPSGGCDVPSAGGSAPALTEPETTQPTQSSNPNEKESDPVTTKTASKKNGTKKPKAEKAAAKANPNVKINKAQRESKAKPKPKAKGMSGADRRGKGGAITSMGAGKLSALDAAAQVLKGAAAPMSAQDLITVMEDRKLWKSPGGKTPSATLYSGMIRETARLGKKGTRFVRVSKGLFEYQEPAIKE